MLFQVVIENGQKKIQPLTADAGAGAPVGSLISMYKKSSPSGYLYCDGSTFDANAYPLLYAYLGSNVLPDYREFALVGAEQNTTDTIASHDVYTEGQAKDDQLQEIEGSFTTDAEGIGKVISTASGAFELENSMNVYAPTASSTSVTRHDVKFKASNVARAGTVTRGKRKAAYFYIKATSGLSENAQDNVINTLNEQRSYSTEEHLTGKKWIDGKPTYEITKVGSETFSSNAWTEITFFNDNVPKHIVNVTGLIFNTTIRVRGTDKDFTNTIGFATSGSTSMIDYQITLEYTKTV